MKFILKKDNQIQFKFNLSKMFLKNMKLITKFQDEIVIQMNQKELKVIPKYHKQYLILNNQEGVKLLLKESLVIQGFQETQQVNQLMFF